MPCSIVHLPPHSLRRNRAGVIRSGFTLIELLTVIAIIGILAGILFPTVNSVMEKARKATSSNNLRQIGSAMALYTQDNKGLLPAPNAGSTDTGTGSQPNSPNPTGQDWLVEINPYVDGQNKKNGPFATVVVSWGEVLQDPQFVLSQSGISNPDFRGYGMMIYPYRPDFTSANQKANDISKRQRLDKLPDQARNVLVGTSTSDILDPSEVGTFSNQGSSVFINGDPGRYGGLGLYLFVDAHMQALSPEDAALLLQVAPQQ